MMQVIVLKLQEFFVVCVSETSHSSWILLVLPPHSVKVECCIKKRKNILRRVANGISLSFLNATDKCK